MIEYWPRNLVPASIMFRIKPMTAKGPFTYSGKRQTVAQDAGFWVAELTNFPVVDDEAILEWRGTLAALEGSANDLIIGPFDSLRAPTFADFPPVIEGIPHSDGALFSDSSGYSQSTIKVSLAEDVELRSTTALLTVEQAGTIRKGMYFTIWSDVAGVSAPRMYIITAPPDTEGDRVSIKFRPPLRAEAAAGTGVDFADPKLLMNLSDEDAGSLDLEYGLFSRPSISLEESWNGIS
jgi:hypothetical protein